jgi:DedD protein
MATSASNEASEIRRRGRQRLVGAVAIVLLLVVFVPMVLDSEPRPARNEPTLTIPPKNNAPPLVMPSAAPTGTPAPVAAPAPATTPTPPAEPPKGAGVTQEPAAKAPKLEGFAVQVGAFRDDEKLRQAREKLAAAGVKHYTERIDSSTGALTRLRAGPFPTREAADAAVAKLQGISLQGKVVPLP